MSNSRKILQENGERFLPWMKDPVINYEHLHRYGFARQFVKGKKVLDLACGEGYGSAILAQGAGDVIGVDIDEAAIKHASRRYVKDNLRFVRSSITQLVIKGEKIFDVIVCFEALEHIKEHDKAMAEVKRLLKDDGLFIVSMPNRYLYSDQSNYENPWHKKELYFDEFKTLLGQSFKDVLIYGQKVFPASNIFPMFEKSGVTQELIIEKTENKFSFVALDKKQARYFIAIASNDLVEPAIGSSYLVDSSDMAYPREAAVGRSGELEIMRRELEAIYNSRGWKVLQYYYRLRDKIFPPGRKRRAYSKSLMGMAVSIIKKLRGN